MKKLEKKGWEKAEMEVHLRVPVAETSQLVLQGPTAEQMRFKHYFSFYQDQKAWESSSD